MNGMSSFGDSGEHARTIFMLTFSKVKQLAWPVSLDALQDYKDIKLIAPVSDWSWQHSCKDREVCYPASQHLRQEI